MVQEINSDGSGDRMAGLLGPDRSQAPTAAAPEFPESTSDRERNKFRRSYFRRLTQIAVCNDDGSEVTAKVEELLQALLVESIKQTALLTEIRDK